MRVFVAMVTLSGSLLLMRTLWWTDSSGSRRYVLFDDAMISLSYGRSLVRGDGLTWFDGAERVQGFTNLGWTLFMAPLTAFGSARTTSLVVSFIGVLVLIAIGLLILELVRESVTSVRIAAAVIVVLHFPLVYWTIRGMEVGLIALISLAIVINSRESNRRSEVLVALLIFFGVIVRLDVILVAFALAVVSWLLDGRTITRRSLIPLLTGLASASLVVVAQKIYYGSWAPNTMSLKMSGGSISERIAAGIDSVLRHPYGLLFAVAAIGVSSIEQRPLVWRLSSIAIVYNCYSVFVGGDSWEWFANRYFAVATPFATIALIIALDGQWARRRSVIIALAAWASVSQIRLLLPDRSTPEDATVIVIVLITIVFLITSWRPRVETWTVLMLLVMGSSGWILDVMRDQVFDHQADVTRVERALAIRNITDDNAIIAVVSAGTQVYISDRPAVDLLGKSDPRIASLPRRIPFFPGHDKWDLEISTSDPRPDVFLEEVGKDFSDLMLNFNYDSLCTSNGVQLWVSLSSTHVDRTTLSPC